jgi:hypothetical protein
MDLRMLSVDFLVTQGLGLSLSDQYWIKPAKSDFSWERINFFDNEFSDDIGDFLFNYTPPVNGKYDLFSPEVTSTGNLRKKWKSINGERNLIKSSTKPHFQDPFNEVAAYEIARRLGIDNVKYEFTLLEERPVSICPCFVKRNTELVSASQLIAKGDYPYQEGYDRFVANCEVHGLTNVTGFLDRMIVLDYLIVNMDRHFNNFGFLRDVDSLEWLGPAPLFDNGLSLWNNEPEDIIKSGFVAPCKSFRRTHGDQISLVKDFSWVKLESLEGVGQSIFDIMSKNTFISEEKAKALSWGIDWRIGHLTQYIKNQQQELSTPHRGQRLR